MRPSPRHRTLPLSLSHPRLIGAPSLHTLMPTPKAATTTAATSRLRRKQQQQQRNTKPVKFMDERLPLPLKTTAGSAPTPKAGTPHWHTSVRGRSIGIKQRQASTPELQASPFTPQSQPSLTSSMPALPPQPSNKSESTSQNRTAKPWARKTPATPNTTPKLSTGNWKLTYSRSSSATTSPAISRPASAQKQNSESRSTSPVLVAKPTVTVIQKPLPTAKKKNRNPVLRKVRLPTPSYPVRGEAVSRQRTKPLRGNNPPKLHTPQGEADPLVRTCFVVL